MVILGHFLPIIPLKNPKIKIFKNGKIYWRYHHFTHVHHKSQSYDVQFLRYGQNFFAILGHLLPFTSHPTPQPPPNNSELNIKILKKKKNGWRYYPFIHTCVP